MATAFHDGVAAAVTRRAVSIALAVPLLLLLVTGAAAWWVLNTGSGSQWLWTRVAAAVPGALTAESVEGALAEGFSVRGLVYANDGVRVEVTSAAFELGPRLLPPAATLSEVRIGSVTVRRLRAPSPADPEGASLRQIFSSLRLPVPVWIESLVLDSFSVLSHDGREIFAMQRSRMAGGVHDSIRLQRASVDLADFRLEATGSLGLDPPNDLNGSLRVRMGPAAFGSFPGMPVELEARFEGDLDNLEVDISSSSPEFRIVGHVRDALDEFHWDLRLRSDYLQWPLNRSLGPLVLGRAVDLRTEGRPQGYTLQGRGVVQVRGGMEADAIVDAVGTTRGIEIGDLQLSGAAVQAVVQGDLDWSSGFGIAAAGDISRFEPHALVSAWPEGQSVSGSFDAAWTGGRIELAELHAQVPDTAMSLDANGTIDAVEGVVDLGIDWRGLQWPTGGENAQVQSDSGRIRLAGRLDAWLVDGRVQLAIAGYPEGIFVLRGEGDREQVAVTLNESHLLGGTAAGQLQYNWVEGGEWSASVAARNLHTRPLATQWPGVLNARFDATGRVRPFGIDVNIRTFDGTLRDVPVRGKGGLRYAPETLRFRGFEVVSGESSVKVDGSLRGDAGIDFDVDIAALDDFLLQAAGTIAAKGNLVLADGFPQLAVQLEGRNLAWEQYRIGGLAVLSRESGDALPLDLEVQAQAVNLGNREFDTVTGTIAAGPEGQRLEANVTSAMGNLSVSLDGAFDDWRRPLDSSWRGRLMSMTVAAGDGLALALEDPVKLELSADSVAIEQACLRGEAALGICGTGHWSGPGDFRAVANLTAFPVDALGRIADTGLEFTQTLDGALSFSQRPAHELSGDIQLDVSGGRIRNRLDERVETTTRPGRLQMQLDDGRLLAGHVNLPFSTASEIDGRFEVLDVGLGEMSRVQGQLQLDVADIGAAANVVPMIDAAAGTLEADITLSGTLGQPRFTGTGSLRNGSLRYEPLGLELTEIQLSGDIKEQNRLELQGTFRAGEGSGRLYTSADYLAGRQTGLRVSLSGENLAIVNVPDVRVIANPELDFGLHEGTITINGRIVLPQARLSPANLAANSVRESRDVVVVAGQDEKPEAKPAEGPAVAINGEVDLVLGNDIVIDLDIADARVTGQTTFRWNGPVMPVADGQYQVSGNVQAYGQLLQITEGLINFTNVPADNPLLRIRAEREIFGNSQIRSAGVFVSGTAKDPEVEIYTNPATTESRALTLLVTGSEFNFEQGVGAVDVGTYIAPKLYLSYGIGLFDRENVISLRYDLAKGFGIKASSSTRTDGVDLSYTVER